METKASYIEATLRFCTSFRSSGIAATRVAQHQEYEDR